MAETLRKTLKKKEPKPTKFFHFHQNNSGGRFSGPALNVVIEAESAEHANRLAEDHGLYFHGVDEGSDCDCCGDRWYAQWGDDRGTAKPLIYDKEPDKAADKMYKQWATQAGVPFCVVYYLNGDEEEYN